MAPIARSEVLAELGFYADGRPIPYTPRCTGFENCCIRDCCAGRRAAIDELQSKPVHVRAFVREFLRPYDWYPAQVGHYGRLLFRRAGVAAPVGLPQTYESPDWKQRALAAFGPYQPELRAAWRREIGLALAPERAPGIAGIAGRQAA